MTTDRWWTNDTVPVLKSIVVGSPTVDSYPSTPNRSKLYLWSSNGEKRHTWSYEGYRCFWHIWSMDSVQSYIAETIREHAVHSVRPDSGPPGTGGAGYLGDCSKPDRRVGLNFTVKPKPPKPPAPLSCRLDASPSVDILAPSGHSQRPIAAEVVCTGKGEAHAVVRTTSPRTVVVADGVTVVLNGQLDESTPVSGGASYPIDLHVDVENIRGEPGGYSVSYVLTVDLT